MAKSKLETGAEQVGKWSNLPGDILVMILSHLFGKDYICFRSVCRSWRSVQPPLRSIPDPYLSEASRYPSLFHFSGNSSMCKFYDPFYNGSYVSQIPDELIDSIILFSSFGWLLMSQGQQLFFFHPFTNERIYLPCALQGELKWCFSSPPTSPDCMVFCIGGNDHMGRNIYLNIIHRDEDSWFGFSYRRDNVSFCSSYSHSNPIFYKGSFYCLSLDGKLGAFFDPEKRGWGLCDRGWKIIDKLKYPCESIKQNFLVESNGDLISICMGSIGEYVKVFKLKYDNEIRWEEVHSLGDQMIFAGRTGCISMRTHTMGNTIYFPIFDNEGNGLFYSLASRKFHSLGLSLARKDLYNMKYMLHCAWLTPNASEIYTRDELTWLTNPEVFVPSTGRVNAVTSPRSHPSFILTNRKDSKNQLFFNMFDSHHNAEELPELRQMQTVTCAFGWLFQVNRDFSDCLLLNPQTKEKIHLPRLPARFLHCAISSSPNDPNCIVLLVHYYRVKKDDRIDFIYCRPGESEWTIVTIKDSEELNFDSEELNIDSDSEEFELWHLLYDTILSVVGCQGKIYCLLLSDFKWVEIEFDPIFKVEHVKSNIPDEVLWSWSFSYGTSDEKTYMVESCGELFVIRVDLQLYGENPSKIANVVVFKLDRNRKIWEIVGSLGENIAFFCYDRRCCISSTSPMYEGMGNGCCISSSSMEKGKGNSIYFIDCFSDARNIYRFHFEDGSISVSSPFPEVDIDEFEWTGLTFN